MRIATIARFVLPLTLLALSACMVVEDEGFDDAPRKNQLVEAEIERRIGEMQYMSGLELYTNQLRLAEMGQTAVPHLNEALKSEDALTRSSAVFVFQLMGDRRNIPAMRPLLADPSRNVRYQAAASLVELGDSSGFDVLVEGLADGEIRLRYKCFETLRRATGRDFGYRHDGHPEEREEAVSRWIDWLVDLRTSAM